MAMSEQARRALAASVRLNPDGARQLYAILRTAPAAVKRKPTDPFGPLAMMERISRSALAEAIEACLRQNGQPVPTVSGRWHRIRPTDGP
jgi:hypothetical protein